MPLCFENLNIRFLATSVPSITVSFSNLPYETMLNDCLQTRPTITLCSAETRIRREDVFVTTKLWNTKASERQLAILTAPRFRSTHCAREGPGSNGSPKYWVSRATGGL